MKNKKVIFTSLFLAGTLFAAPCFAASPKDATIDCAGVPYWDRFIVNDNDTRWSADGKCYGGTYGDPVKAAQENLQNTDTAKKNSGTDWQNLYGYYNGDNPENKNLYGYVHGDNPAAKPEPKPIVESKPKPAAKPAAKKTAAAVVPVKKEPAKPKPAPKPAPKPEPAPLPACDPTIAPAAPKPVQKAADADKIAKAAKSLTPEDFCTQRNAPVMGKLPSGMILMPGAPQSMSCIK